MQTDTFITETDDEDAPTSNVVSLFGSSEPPLSIGDVLAGFVLPDLAVRMRGDFLEPRIVAFTVGREQ